jgi:hydrogenase-4 component F
MLFFSSGNLLLKFNSSKINKIKGALSIIPFTSIFFIMGFLMLTGMPPFGIFYSKLLILSMGITTYPIITIMAIIFTAIVFVGFLKHVIQMFFGESSGEVTAGESSRWLVVPPLVLLVVVICLSFYFPPFLSELINMVSLTY